VVTSLLGRIDKRFFFGPFSPATLRELPEPELPAPDWVTIRTRLCGICGSDCKQMFLNGSMDNPMTAVISFPQVLGHEVVGTIERVGPGVRTRTAGERVVLNPWLSCAPRGLQPPWPACAEGQESIFRPCPSAIQPPRRPARRTGARHRRGGRRGDGRADHDPLVRAPLAPR